MDLHDLRLFTVCARHASLQRAAGELHLTPSALSKALRRLEDELRTPLFDRAGKALVLNAAGQRLQDRALALLNLAEQTRAEFTGAGFAVDCRIAAPALLQARYAGAWGRALAALGGPASLRLVAQFEHEALASLQRGEVDFAVVSSAVFGAVEPPAGLSAEPLESIGMQVAVAPGHALARKRAWPVASVLAHDFACPARSLLCGLRRGAGSDGWRDDLLPRRIRYVADDLHALLALVQAGAAAACLPAFLIAQQRLATVQVRDEPFRCEEQTLLVWRPSAAMGWQARWVAAFLAEVRG